MVIQYHLRLFNRPKLDFGVSLEFHKLSVKKESIKLNHACSMSQM